MIILFQEMVSEKENLAIRYIIAVCLVSGVSSHSILEDTVRHRRAACTVDWNPVCGVNNVTYGNRCMLETK